MENVVEVFMKLVKISSPSKQERMVADEIKKYCKNLGLFVEEDDTGSKIDGNCGNLIVRMDGVGDPILFDAHMDTVRPCDEVRPIRKDGIIYSDGTSILGADDKAGIAAILCMLETIVVKKLPHPPITCIFGVCEEEGLTGIKHVNKEVYKDIRYAFVLDGEGDIGTIVSKTPYGCKGELRIIGKEAHAGVCPEKGIHALVVASQAISALTIGRIHEGLTCNIGKIHGGKANNIVMHDLQMSFEARGFQREQLVCLIEHTKHVFQTACDHAKATFEEHLTYGTAGYTIDEEEDIVTLFKKACTKEGFRYQSEPCGGGSHANIYRMMNTSALCVGTNMKHVHSLQESIAETDLIKLEALLLAIVSEVVECRKQTI